VVTPDPDAPAFVREAKEASSAKPAAMEDIVNNLAKIEKGKNRNEGKE
jgi:hypothetical protein